MNAVDEIQTVRQKRVDPVTRRLVCATDDCGERVATNGLCSRHLFWTRVDFTDDCWSWLGSKNTDGYGQYTRAGKNQKAHRIAYAELVGPIPTGLVLDHLCRNRACVNPDHLEPVTSRENTLRGDTLPARFAGATRCINGHPFDDLNTRILSSGYRVCKECSNRSGRAYRAARAINGTSA